MRAAKWLSIRFSHDASVRALPAASSTAQVVTSEAPFVVYPSNQVPARTMEDFENWIRSQGEIVRNPSRFFLFGYELSVDNSYQLPNAVVVQPRAIVAH